MAEKPDPELDALLDAAAKDFQAPSSSEPKSALGEFDASQFLNPDGSVNNEKWKLWEEEQNKKGDEMFKKAQEDLMNSAVFQELQQTMQESLAAVCDEQGISREELSNQLKGLNLFGEDKDKGFSDAIMGAMQSLKNNLPEAGSGADSDKDKEFSDAISGAMQSLKDNLSEAFPTQREGEDGESGDGLNFMGNMENLSSVMQQMMLALLSKEMLLPSFKEMSEKYPGWLEENKSKLSESNLKRYTEQLSMVKQIVEELEKPGPEDDQKHLDRMIELMQKMQDLGQPPKELVSQLVNALDDTKIDSIMKDSGADQCSIM